MSPRSSVDKAGAGVGNTIGVTVDVTVDVAAAPTDVDVDVAEVAETVVCTVTCAAMGGTTSEAVVETTDVVACVAEAVTLAWRFCVFVLNTSNSLSESSSII